MTLQQNILDARDARERELQRAFARARSENAASILALGTNVPGPDKHRPGLSDLLHGGMRSFEETIGLKVIFSGRDLLGSFLVASSNASPGDAKRASVVIENARPSGRLLDADVYGPDGAQIDRATLGLPQRACLICLEPAFECIRLKRHTEPEILACVDSLLEPFATSPKRLLPQPLATHLTNGALGELNLTPKPGLVDRHDSGSHKDLSYAGMRISAGLLPLYFDDILRCFQQKSPLEDYVQAGIEAEARMTREIHSNAHKGYIFLAGLVLMAACECEGQVSKIRPAIADTARRFFSHFESRNSHGAEIRSRLALGGIRVEAERGLPAVFEHGWPRYREALKAGWEPEHAGFYLMAILMQHVEDTTAVRRCGLEGLSRLRKDGARIQTLLEQGQAPEAFLATLNEEYCRLGLTMGGVADCIALTLALQGAAQK